LYLSEVQTPQALLALDWQTLWALSNESPHAFCEKILAAIGLRVADLERCQEAITAGKEPEARRINKVLLQPEQHISSSRDIPPKSDAARLSCLFELICSSMFACMPNLLPAFVKLVTKAADAAQAAAAASPQAGFGVTASPQPAIGTAARHKGFAERALAAIPCTLHRAAEQKATPEQIAAVSRMLVISKLPLSALLLLLRNGLWEEGLRLIEESASNQEIRANTAELFSVALHDCMRSRNVERLRQLLARARLHPSLTALDLV
jgi:hypothetical protein